MFDKFDDRVSSFEAPVTSGFLVDVNGGSWDNRPDNIINKYMSKVSMSQDNYWIYKKYMDNRQWFELDMFLERLGNNSEGEDVVRIKKAREFTNKIIKEG